MAGASSLPFSIRANASVANNRLDVTISPKRLASPKPVENVVVTCQMPSNVTNLSLTPTVGTYSFDTFQKLLKWDVSIIKVD